MPEMSVTKQDRKCTDSGALRQLGSRHLGRFPFSALQSQFSCSHCTHSLHVAKYRCYYYDLILHLLQKLPTLLYVLLKMS